MQKTHNVISGAQDNGSSKTRQGPKIALGHQQKDGQRWGIGKFI